jgi:hypothetical protein
MHYKVWPHSTWPEYSTTCTRRAGSSFSSAFLYFKTEGGDGGERIRRGCKRNESEEGCGVEGVPVRIRGLELSQASGYSANESSRAEKNKTK